LPSSLDNEEVCREGEINKRGKTKQFVKRVMKRLLLTQGTDIRGRKASDAAFNFAMAGITDLTLFESLVYITRMELVRTGHRSSTKVKDVLQMVEKLAASGVQGLEAEKLFDVAASCLEKKRWRDSSGIINLLREHRFDFSDDRPLLWLWRFSARQDKIRTVPFPSSRNSGQSEDTRWMDTFDDPTRPLIVDVGCGMGVSLLGLASMSKPESTNVQRTVDCTCPSSTVQGSIDKKKDSTTIQTPPKHRMFDEDIVDDWAECNFVGCELNPLFVGYANGMARRWGINGKCQFLVSDANEFIDMIHRTYKGPISLVMIQFPTPFSLQKDEHDQRGNSHNSGNSQLPSNSLSGFMVTEALLQSVQCLLQRSDNGLLLLQSNCEDVAVAMRDIATRSGRLQILDVIDTVTADDTKVDISNLPQRTREWIDLGGDRAVGRGWSKKKLLPRRGRTETEVACISKGTPIHRCIMQARPPPS